MSNLDEILDKYGWSTSVFESGEYNDASELVLANEAKRQIKALMLELIGPGEVASDGYGIGKNMLRAELRAKVAAL